MERLRWVLPIVPPLGWTQLGPKLVYSNHLRGRNLSQADGPAFERAPVLALIEKLSSGILGYTIPNTLASATAMRRIRAEVMAACLNAWAEYDDDALCTVTVVKSGWVLTPEELQRTPAWLIKERFEQDLKRTGIASLEGPLVGFLHGEYEPTNNVYILHFHIVTTREKGALMARKLRALKRAYGPSKLVKRPIRVSKMGDRIGQITYLLKSYWPSRPILMIDGKERRCRRTMRIPEPYASCYLLWLDQQSLIDLTVMNGAWSRRKGGSAAWRAFYVLVTGYGRTRRSRGKAGLKSGSLRSSTVSSMGGG